MRFRIGHKVRPAADDSMSYVGPYYGIIVAIAGKSFRVAWVWSECAYVSKRDYSRAEVQAIKQGWHPKAWYLAKELEAHYGY